MARKGLIEELYNEITPESKEFIEKNDLEELLFSPEMVMAATCAYSICEYIEEPEKISVDNYNLQDLIIQIISKKINRHLSGKSNIYSTFIIKEDFEVEQLYNDLAKILILYMYEDLRLREKEEKTTIGIYG